MGPMEARAHLARQEHTRRRREKTYADCATETRIQQLGHRHASLVRQAPARFTARLRLWAQSALAMRATGGLPEAPAQSAVQESTRQRDRPNARHVPQASIQQPSGPQSHQHAKVVRCTPARLKAAQSALATRATRGQSEARARIAILGSTRARYPSAAKTARLTPTRLLRALRSLLAPATGAGRGLMEEHARRAAQASTRSTLDMAPASAARKARAHLSRAQL